MHIYGTHTVQMNGGKQLNVYSFSFKRIFGCGNFSKSPPNRYNSVCSVDCRLLPMKPQLNLLRTCGVTKLFDYCSVIFYQIGEAIRVNLSYWIECDSQIITNSVFAFTFSFKSFSYDFFFIQSNRAMYLWWYFLPNTS